MSRLLIMLILLCKIDFVLIEMVRVKMEGMDVFVDVKGENMLG